MYHKIYLFERFSMNSPKIFFIGLSLFLISAPALFADKDVALILKVSGTAEIKTQNTNWKPLKRGTRLNGGDQVRTGKQSLVAIVFTDDKSLMKIRSISQVTIHGERSKSGIQKRINLRLGQLWAKVKPGSSDFRIETPTGVAAVKGTEFYVNFTIDGLMEVIGVEGQVQLSNKMGNVIVGARQKGILQAGQIPRLIPVDAVPNWGALTGDEKEILIELIDEEGNKKNLRIKFQ